MSIKHSCYLRVIFDIERFNKAVNACVRCLKARPEINAIAASGVSGITFAAAVAYKAKKSLIVVRKEKEKHYSHAEIMVEGGFDGARYLIVDDLISSGKTLAYIVQQIETTHEAECLGYCLYNSTHDAKSIQQTASSGYGFFPRVDVAKDMIKGCIGAYPF